MEIESVSSYRNKQAESSDSDSDDSQKDFVWKRANRSIPKLSSANKAPPAALPVTVEPQAVAPTQQPISRKRKANNIWSTVLEDQTMSETFKDCGLRSKPANAEQRTCESYDYTLKYSDPRCKQVYEEVFSDEKMSDETDSSNYRQVKRQKTSSSRYVKLNESGVTAAKKIIRILNEQKHYLIFRVVKVLGEEMALKILRMTEDIEENGGMMIKNNSRRRTPGGVYFQLLKSEKSITKEQTDEIFEGECSTFELRKLYKEQKKKQKTKKTVESMDVAHNKPVEETLPKQMDEPALTLPELDKPSLEMMPKQIDTSEYPCPPLSNVLATSDSIELEEGEIED